MTFLSSIWQFLYLRKEGRERLGYATRSRILCLLFSACHIRKPTDSFVSLSLSFFWFFTQIARRWRQRYFIYSPCFIFFLSAWVSNICLHFCLVVPANYTSLLLDTIGTLILLFLIIILRSTLWRARLMMGVCKKAFVFIRCFSIATYGSWKNSWKVENYFLATFPLW